MADFYVKYPIVQEIRNVNSSQVTAKWQNFHGDDYHVTATKSAHMVI